MEIKTFFIMFNHISDKICFRKSLRTLQLTHTLCSQVFHSILAMQAVQFSHHEAVLQCHSSEMLLWVCFFLSFFHCSASLLFPPSIRTLSHFHLFKSQHTHPSLPTPYWTTSSCINTSNPTPLTDSAKFPWSPLQEQSKHLKCLSVTLHILRG